ncbi:MAG: hypothetical protein ACOYXA_05020 [Bacteroidota bacterium]
MVRVIISYANFRNHRRNLRWFLFVGLYTLAGVFANAQTDIGILVTAGNRQHYTDPQVFKNALAPSLAVSWGKNRELNSRWNFRYDLVAGVLGYKLNVIMIDTLGANGDVTPFPEYSTFFGSAEFILGYKLFLFQRELQIGGGVGLTCYGSFVPVSQYGVEVLSPNNNLIALFDGEMNSPANRFSILSKVAAYYKLSSSWLVGIAYIRHGSPAAEGNYRFYHTNQPISGRVSIYQNESRLGVFYVLPMSTRKLSGQSTP